MLSEQQILETFESFLKEKGTLKACTCQYYCNDVQKFLHFLEVMEKKVADIDENVIQEFQKYLEFQNYNISSQNRIQSTLRRFLGFLLKEGFIQKDYADMIRYQKAESKPVNTLTDEQVGQVFGHINSLHLSGMRDKVVFLLITTTPLKINEIINLNRRDVRENGLFAMGNFHEVSQDVLQAISDYLQRLYYVVPRQRPEDPLFANAAGYRITRQAIEKNFKFYLKQAGFENKYSLQSLKREKV